MTAAANTPGDKGISGAKVLTIALYAAVLLLLLPFVSGLLGAIILFVVASPLFARLRLNRVRQLAAFLVVMFLFAVLVVPGAWLLAELVSQIPDAARTLEQSAVVQRLMALRIGALDVGAELRNATQDIVAWSSRQTVAILGGVMSATVNLVIALFGTYYLLVSGDRLWSVLKGVLPFSRETSELLRVRFKRVTEAMLLGVVLTALAQGTMVGVALAVLGFKQPLFWGSVTAVVSILPMFGSSLVWLPAALILAAQQRFGAALALFAFGLLLVSSVDNALRLIVYRRVSQIHPMVTLVGAFAGIHAFGVAGLLLGPLVLSYAVELVVVYHLGNRLVTPANAASKAFPVEQPATALTAPAPQLR